ncbi:MAG: hypothetical protein U0935_25230 [Pirellulales bacterium]
MFSRYFKTPAHLKPHCRVWGLPVRVVVYLAMISLTSLLTPWAFSLIHRLA